LPESPFIDWREEMRNHVAKALWTPKFRPKAVKSKKSYSRKSKHKVNYNG